MTDTECIRMILRGRKDFYEYLVDKYQHKVFNLCSRMLRNREDALDAAQDSFVKAYEGLNGFRLESAFSTWLFRIVYNVCVSKLRHDRQESAFGPAYRATVSGTAYNDGITRLEQEDTRSLLEQAYQALSSDEVFLVEQYYREECSIDELAVMTRLSPANVKVKLFRARKKMYHFINAFTNEEVLQWQTR